MWNKTEKSLSKRFEFKSFDEAFLFIEKITKIAKRLNHHPKIINDYKMVELWLSTHSAGETVTEKDEAFAKEVDAIFNIEELIPTTSELIVYTDGGSRGNPGPSATGIVIYDQHNKIILEDAEYIGETTNNQAEYQAVKKAISLALKLGAKQLQVFMDSELIIKQLRGEYKIKNHDLLEHYKQIKDLEHKLEKISYTHVRREFKKAADALVNQALDANK